jgi:Mg-chelatase subunit ChlD
MIYQSNPTSNGVHRANAPLDIMFIQDVTESQQRYIDTARNGITQIYNTLAPQDLRLGLIAFRDHPPQEHSFLTQEYPFTSDFGSFASNLANLRAEGGGDEPDAQTDALAAACNADWRAEARKIVVLVTDSPPHGIGEDGDAFPEGCPLQIDPLRVATNMGRAGITLYVIACEPTLSENYRRARAFYQGLVKKTGGMVINLGDFNVLSTLIAGSALEAADSEISLRLHKNSVDAGTHVDIWFNAENLDEAKNQIQQVEGNRVLGNYQIPGAGQLVAV